MPTDYPDEDADHKQQYELSHDDKSNDCEGVLRQKVAEEVRNEDRSATEEAEQEKPKKYLKDQRGLFLVGHVLKRSVGASG